MDRITDIKSKLEKFESTKDDKSFKFIISNRYPEIVLSEKDNDEYDLFKDLGDLYYYEDSKNNMIHIYTKKDINDRILDKNIKKVLVIIRDDGNNIDKNTRILFSIRDRNKVKDVRIINIDLQSFKRASLDKYDFKLEISRYDEINKLL